MGSLHVALPGDGWLHLLREWGHELPAIRRWAAERDIPVADEADPQAVRALLRATYPRLVPTRVLAPPHDTTLWLPPSVALLRAPGVPLSAHVPRAPERRRPSVRIRGGRSDPDVAEAALAAADEVDECAVVVRRRAAGTVLIGYVTLLPGWLADPAVLRDYLAARVAAPRVPDRLLVLDRFPRTADGAIDRENLPEPA
jgi:AMP-binding enzyme C-terminal domain